jgi:prepilin-type N-terminal cleavage/methylation domain-containing protein
MRMGESSQRGFTLIEIMVVVAIGLIIAGMSIGGVPSMLKTSRADAGLTELAQALRFARESSISNRRNVRISFGTNTITITRVEYCATPCTPTTTTLRTVTLEGRSEFRLVTGLPDTPDLFGNSTATALGSYTPAMFTTDGSFINSQGDVLNGSAFISIPGDTTSARAITIFGPTGAMHLWRWNGRAWVEV